MYPEAGAVDPGPEETIAAELAPTGTPVVETHDLTKAYRRNLVAVDRLNLTIRAGEVYAILGPNGAGKTTTLRMLLGLIHPTAGSARVGGAAPGSEESLRQVGAMVEAPLFYPHLSGRANLRLMARYCQVPESRIPPALEQVEMTARAGDKFREYSTGMKQRLGVAAALLKDPHLLILDEPTSGMDAEGIVEMRTLLRTQSQAGRAVLMSSHILSEVQQVADRVMVIRQGRTVAEGTMAELLGTRAIMVRAEPLDRATKIAEELAGKGQVQVTDGTLRISIDAARAGEVNRRLVTSGVDVTELRPVQHSLEEVFLDLTDEKGQEKT